MKKTNKFILFSTFAIFFSCNIVEKDKIKESIKPSVPSSPVKIEQTILPSILPSLVSTPTPITTETSASEKVYPPLSEKFKDPLSTREIYGFVYDLDSNPIENANVVAELIKDYNPYEFKIETKTDKTGAFHFSTYPDFLFTFKATKDGYTVRNAEGRSQDLYGPTETNLIRIYINKNPEINEISFNSKKILYFHENNDFRKNINYYSRIKESEDENIKIKNNDNLNIELKFNTSINKQIFEDNFIIQNINNYNDVISKEK